jgi:hypothetical protein
MNADNRTAPLHVQEGAATEWRRWFAWHPVRLSSQVYECPGYSYWHDGSWTWLRWVERRRFYAAPWFVIHRWDEFRRPTGPL